MNRTRDGWLLFIGGLLLLSLAVALSVLMSRALAKQTGGQTVGALESAHEGRLLSDRRLKKNIAKLDSGLDEVLKLQPVSFEWKHEPQGRRTLGFVAQDVRQVLPHLVEATDTPERMLSVNYVGMIPVVVSAIQRLADENDELRETVSRQNKTLGEQQRRLRASRAEVEQLRADVFTLRTAVAR